MTARPVSTISIEMDEISDAIAVLREIRGRLAKKHGDAFRRLDRSIQAFVDKPADCVQAHWVGGGKCILAPKGRLTEIFREARRIGVMD